MDDTLEYLMSQIEERRKAIIESLGDGASKSFEEYKYAAGIVRGLLTAQSIIADLAKRMENSDE
jgi:hypothetical protein